MASFWKTVLPAFGLAALMGSVGPARASHCSAIGDACNVTKIQTAFGTNGQSYSNVYYAGLIDFRISNWNGGAQHVFMVSDDPHQLETHTGGFTYYLEDADAYLAPLGSTTIIHEIAGLAFYALANKGNAVNAGDAQMAIWDLMDGAGGFKQNDHIALLETQASYFYSLLVQQGWSYAELESPTGNCAHGTVTFQSGCQATGQLVLLNPVSPVIVLPEPGTLGLFGMALLGLSGLGWMRSRRGFGTD